MGYRECEHYCEGYCLKGEKTANGMNYPCIERNDCPEVTTAYWKEKNLVAEKIRLMKKAKSQAAEKP